MPIYAVRSRLVDAPPTPADAPVAYYRASSVSLVAAALRSRQMVADEVREVAEGPEGWQHEMGLIVIHDPPPELPAMEAVEETRSQAIWRRLKLVAIGLGLGAVAGLGLLFVMKAKEHLLRRDIIPPGAVLERSPVQGGTR